MAQVRARTQACKAMGEPEPMPAEGAGCSKFKQSYDAWSTTLVHEQLQQELNAYYQLMQLSADLAQLSSPLAHAAGFFAHLAEQTRMEAGSLMDLLIGQGSQVCLPALHRPCSNLVSSTPGTNMLADALEACVQLEDSKRRRAFVEAVKGADLETRKLAEALYLRYRRTREVLVRHLTAVERMTDQGALIMYSRAL